MNLKNKTLKNEKNFLNFLPYIITGAVTVGILLIVFAINHIYPFGTGSVVCDDMVQQTISNYTYFWDYLHSGGAKSLLFNWETAAGTQVLTTGFYILKPWEIIFTLLCSRDSIVNGIPFLLIFKITAASLAMVFFLRKEFKIEPFWQSFLGLAYGCSSFIIIYYTNMGWIDAAFLFPFLIIAALHMFRTGKWLPYFLILTYSLLLSIYISYMIFLFLLFVGFAYLVFVQPKKTRKMATIRFGAASVLSLAASAVINVPSIFYMFRSTRYAIKSEDTILDSILKILRTDTTYSTTKLTIVMLATSVFLALLVMLFVNFKEHKKACGFFGCSLLVLGIPVFFENVNLIWHLGSYVGFPLRYGYMIVFMLVCTAAYCIQNVSEQMFSIKGGKNILLIVPALASAALGIYFLISKVYRTVGTVNGLKYNKLVNEDCDTWIIIAFVVLAIFYTLCLFVGIKKLAYGLMSVVMLCEIGLLANISFGTNSSTEDRTSMYSLDFENDALEMSAELGLENDNLSRIKDADVRLNSNYPMFFNYPSLSNFTHLVSSDMTSTMESLGYSQVYTRVIDSVGTPLSDALLNMKYTFSTKALDDYEYTYMRDIGESKLYSDNMTLPVGLLVNQDFMDIDIVENGDVFNTNNELYTALTGDESDIFTTDRFTFDCDDEMITENIHVDGTKHTYLLIDVDSSTSSKRGSLSIWINGEKADLTYFGSDINYNFPNNFHNELIDLGVRTDEDIEIQIGVIKNIGHDVKMTVGYFDSTMLSKLCDMNKNNCATVETGAKSLTATVNCDNDDTYVFLPVTYDEGWTCKVNGEKQEIDIAMSSFMAIKLHSGENVVELHYLPHGMKTGIVITLVTLLAVALLIIIKHKKSIDNEKSNLFLKIFDKVYYVGMIAAITGMYVIPVLYTIYRNIRG